MPYFEYKRLDSILNHLQLCCLLYCHLTRTIMGRVKTIHHVVPYFEYKRLNLILNHLQLCCLSYCYLTRTIMGRFKTIHHHHVVLLARIFLTLSCHFSLSFTTSGRSSGLHPVSSHSCCMHVIAGHPAFARPYVGVHRSTSLMSSSLPL